MGFFDKLILRRKPSRHKKIKNWLKAGGDLADLLSYNESNNPVKKRSEANLILEGLRKISFNEDSIEENLNSPCYVLTNLVCKPKTAKVFFIFKNEALTELRRILSEGLQKTKNREYDLLKIISVLAEFAENEDITRIASIAKSGILYHHEHSYYWINTFRDISSDQSKFKLLLNNFKHKLPTQGIADCFIYIANDLIIEKDLDSHPYKTPHGIKILKEQLKVEEYAYNATVAIAFVDKIYCNELFEIALKNSDTDIKIEAAWAMAKQGFKQGIGLLQEFSLNIHTARKAHRYMTEIDLDIFIPEKNLNDTDFQAMAQMSHWLQHPNEYGKAPDTIKILDKRNLYWPPAEEKLDLWLIEYSFKDDNEVKIGMVGSITFELCSVDKINVTPEIIYAKHCLWEMDDFDSKVEHGIKLLKKYNPNF